MLVAHRPTWRNPVVLATLTAVFLSGAVVGALTMQFGLHRALHSGGVFFSAPGSSRSLSYERLKNDLHLSPTQADQLKSILDDFVRYDQDLEQQIDDVRATGKNRILAILDPNQKQEFERLCAELQSR